MTLKTREEAGAEHRFTGTKMLTHSNFSHLCSSCGPDAGFYYDNFRRTLNETFALETFDAAKAKI